MSRDEAQPTEERTARLEPDVSHGEDPLRVSFTPVEGSGGDATVFSCPLCGNRFSHGGLVCASCPLNLGCEIVRCPHCGYQFPRSSRIVDWARRLVRRPRGGSP